MSGDFLTSFTWMVNTGGYCVKQVPPFQLPGRPETGLEDGEFWNRLSRDPTRVQTMRYAASFPNAAPVLADGVDLDGNAYVRVVAPTDPDAPVKRYRPLSRQFSGLALEFAEIAGSDDDYVGFANRFGLLGIGLQAFASPHALPPGDLLRSLRQVHSVMHDLRDALQRRCAGVDAYAERLLTVQLSAHVTFGMKALGGRYEVGPAPHNLLGALWLQHAFAFGRRVEYTRCAHVNCGRPFEKATGRETGRRDDALFCSDRCRSADARRRRQIARALDEDGTPLSKIVAKTTGEKRPWNERVATVKGWLGSNR